MVHNLRPVIPTGLDLIIAAPQSQRSVMTQALYIVGRLCRDILRKVIRDIIYIAGKHQILPYDDAVFITQIIEII